MVTKSWPMSKAPKSNELISTNLLECLSNAVVTMPDK